MRLYPPYISVYGYQNPCPLPSLGETNLPVLDSVFARSFVLTMFCLEGVLPFSFGLIGQTPSSTLSLRGVLSGRWFCPVTLFFWIKL
ncbi:unnamed protein product [Meloidogyne enterolobii]|uniref:Uncharacterized protein n=1 Tax=Meloidogyne enterolobii TaxID=390850 RepID=A0ACB1A2Q9_MELEN